MKINKNMLFYFKNEPIQKAKQEQEEPRKSKNIFDYHGCSFIYKLVINNEYSNFLKKLKAIQNRIKVTFSRSHSSYLL